MLILLFYDDSHLFQLTDIGLHSVLFECLCEEGANAKNTVGLRTQGWLK